MDIDPGCRTQVTPHQLCALCRTLVTTYSQDCFWDEEAYEEASREYRRIDPQRIGAQAEPLAHHDSLAGLHKSATQGCHLCAIYFGTTKTSYPDEMDGQMQLYVRVSGRSESGCQPIHVKMYEKYPSRKTGTRDAAYVEMHRHPHDAQLEKCRVDVDIRPHDSPEAWYRWCATTDCDEGYEMINAWLQKCVNHHEPCRRSLDDIRPARLLDLNASLHNEDIRLILANDAGKQPYATLSYSWGDRTSVTLKSDNYDAFRSCIELRLLPRTIQEAVKVCRRLSVRYLWVDALCIIQENGEDFAREISQMGSIYAGSLITVAAADSTDCESGCFRERSPLQREVCVVSSGGEVVFFSEDRILQRTHYETLGFSKLNERGWAQQERMMSPRTLHFTRNEIVWECRERTLCYNCAEKAPYRSADLKYDVKKSFLQLHHDWPQSVQSAIFRLTWSIIIRGYSRSILSNADDVLSALAGIAQLAHHKLQYHASYGLWFETLLDELLWSVLVHRKPTGRNVEVLDLAPSWSWASNQCEIWYQNPSSPYVDVGQKVLHSAQITKLPPVTPFGQISTLSKQCPQPVPIRIRGWLRSCQTMPFFALPLPQKPVGWMLVPTTRTQRREIKAYVNAAWETFHKGDYGGLEKNEARLEEFKRLAMPMNLFFIPDMEPERPQNLFCLLLKRVFGDEHDPGPFLAPSTPYSRNTITDFGIVLESVDPAKNLFRRVGYFHEFVTDNPSRYTSRVDDPGPNPWFEIIERLIGVRCSENDELDHNNFMHNYLRPLGFHRGGDEILRHQYALRNLSESESSERYSSLSISDIQNSESDNTNELIHRLLGKLSLFKDECDEVEVEII